MKTENVAETTTRRKSAKQPKATHGSSMNDKETKFRKNMLFIIFWYKVFDQI